MSIFEFTADKVVVTKDYQQIKEFKTLLEHKEAEKYISYVYHIVDYNSPYANYNYEKRKHEVNKDILGGKKPPDIVLEAIKKYKELSETDSIKLLNAARSGARKLQGYFEEIDPMASDDPGKVAKDLMAGLKDVGKLLDSLKDWEDKVMKEKESTTLRRGVKETKYNT